MGRHAASLDRQNSKIANPLTGDHFTAYDNDRTMVRIGWMNMILHGIEPPSFFLHDSLAKSPSEAQQPAERFEKTAGVTTTF
jgi:type I restriction-modification system DNA methylase subunit